MQIVTNCLLVTPDPYLSVDIAMGLEDLFAGIRIHACGSAQEALDRLANLSGIDLAVLDAALERAEGARLADVLDAQGARVTVVGSAPGHEPPPPQDQAGNPGALVGPRRFFFSAELLQYLAGLTDAPDRG